MKQTLILLMVVSAAHFSSAGGNRERPENQEPTRNQVRRYIEERLDTLVFDAITEDDLKPAGVIGTTFFIPDSDILGQSVRDNIGDILYVREGLFRVESLVGGDAWVSEEVPDAEAGILEWFVDQEGGSDVDFAGVAGVAAGAGNAAKISYRRVGQYRIDPEVDFAIEAALFSIEQEAFKDLPGYVEPVSPDNRWIIEGAIVNRITAERYSRWDFEGNVTTNLVGVGGSLYFDSSQSASAAEWRSYYVVTDLASVIRRGFRSALGSDDYSEIAEIVAAIAPDNDAEAVSLAAFFERVDESSAGAALARLGSDEQFREQLNTIPWEDTPVNTDIGPILLLQPDAQGIADFVSRGQPSLGQNQASTQALIVDLLGQQQSGRLTGPEDHAPGWNIEELGEAPWINSEQIELLNQYRGLSDSIDNR
jgi:hypothetical protein